VTGGIDEASHIACEALAISLGLPRLDLSGNSRPERLGQRKATRTSDHKSANELGVFGGHEEADDAAITPTEDVDVSHPKLSEKLRSILRHDDVVERTVDIARSTVPLLLWGYEETVSTEIRQLSREGLLNS